ncbi:ionotropic receptor 75a-like [Periplaneta americana]|uniref:ionotropic receptor 75a-like n=1 Tax=Periplaneta americana TaxID=6978 RepID=UPI0037E8D9F0
MFMKPALSEVSIIYTLPFSTTVWFTYAAVVTILTVALVYSMRAEQSMMPNRKYIPVRWSDAALDSLGIVCQQGASQSPVNPSSRIVFIFLLLLSVFLLTSYSAIIVSLLQTTSNAINTIPELMDSGFTLSMRNISYSTAFVNDTNDPDVKRLYFEKLYTQPPEKAFTTLEVGVANIRKGLHAFQGDADAYKFISDTMEEHEKCRFKEIVFFVTNSLGYPVRKGSPYKELIARKGRWLTEVGFTDFEYKRWYNQKPKCVDNSQGFVSVRIQDFYPTLVVLAYGILLSFVVLFFEVLHHKAQSRLHRGEGRTVPPPRKERRVIAVQDVQHKWLN